MRTTFAVLAVASIAQAQTPAEVRRLVEQATVQIGDGAHAGFLADETHVVGAAHCLQGERGAVRVRFHDGKEIRGRVLAVRADLDLGVVEVPPGHGRTPLPFAEQGEALDPGEMLAHAGHPAGYPFAFTLGRFVGVSRTHQGPPMIRFATWAVPGDSGGPVVCASGRVHGVLVAARRDGGEAYAVPIDFARALIEAPVAEAAPRIEPPPRVETPRRAARVTIYGAEWCAACRSAAAWLRARGVPFQERDADEVPRLAAERGLRLGPAIPVIVVDGGEGEAVVLQGFSPRDLQRALDRFAQILRHPD